MTAISLSHISRDIFCRQSPTRDASLRAFPQPDFNTWTFLPLLSSFTQRHRNGGIFGDDWNDDEYGSHLQWRRAIERADGVIDDLLSIDGRNKQKTTFLWARFTQYDL